MPKVDFISQNINNMSTFLKKHPDDFIFSRRLFDGSERAVNDIVSFEKISETKDVNLINSTLKRYYKIMQNKLLSNAEIEKLVRRIEMLAHIISG